MIAEAAVQMVTREVALEIAREDAARAYRDLSRLQVDCFLGPKGWVVEYELLDPYNCGGGPHYLIDAQTGAILHKTYYQ